MKGSKSLWLVVWLATPLLLSLGACERQKGKVVVDKPSVLARMVPLPMDLAKRKTSEDAPEKSAVFALGRSVFPAAERAGGANALSWTVALGRAKYLDFGYYVQGGGPQERDVELVVSIGGPGADRTEVFRQAIPSDGSEEGIGRARVDVSSFSGEVTIEFNAQSPAANGSSASGEESGAEVTWINPRLVGPGVEEGNRHNIIILCVDTLRADRLKLFGGQRSEMPLLEERIRQGGAAFTDAYSNAAWSLPSMATLLTGRLPGFHHAGYRTELGKGEQRFNFRPRTTEGGIELVINSVRYRFQMLHPSIPTLQEVLGRSGYLTAAVYNNGYINYPTRVLKGMDEAMNYNRLDAMIGTQAGLEWIDRTKGEPFFLYMHYMDPHEWARKAEELNPGWKAKPYKLEDRDVYMNAYDTLVGYTDQAIERLLEGLESRHLLDDTYLVFVADHGESFFDDGAYVGHGDASKEVVLRVPLAILGPGVSATTVADRVSLVDVVPSVLDLLDISGKGVDLDGRSLVPLLNDDRPGRDRTVISEYVLGTADTLALYRGSWKLVLNLRDRSSQLFRIGGGIVANEDVAKEFPDVLAESLQVANRYLKASGKDFRSLSYGKTEIDEQTLRSLRALGYID